MDDNIDAEHAPVEHGQIENAEIVGGDISSATDEQKVELPPPKLDNPGNPGVELDQVMSAVAFGQMGKDKAKWLQDTVRLGTIKFGNVGTAKQKLFIEGNMALIYRGNKVMRTAPFIMKTDSESKHGWAFFEQHAFFGKNLPPWWLPWERAKTKVIMVGISKDSNYCDNLNGEGYLIKVDENSMAQLPMYARYEKAQMNELLEDSRHNSQVQLLWRQLNKYENPTTNWWFIGVILLIILIVGGIAGFFLLFPNAWSGITGWINGLGAGFIPPGTPTHGPG